MEEQKSVFDISMAKTLSNKYNIPIEDVIMISLNRYGVRANIDDNRIRFKLRPVSHEEIFYFAVCVNTFDSPFELYGNSLLLNGQVIADVIDIEKDTCDTTYFRRNNTELTLNSNMRSQCQGCKFCGTYNMHPEDKVDMSDEYKIQEFVEKYLKSNNIKDLSDLVRTTICTGCFKNEDKLVEHILNVYNVFSKYGFKRRIRYIGSQIRSENAMDKIKEKIPYFSLSLTVECFSKRNERMREEKAILNIEKMKDILNRANIHGFSTNYLYIAALDELDVLEEGNKQLKPYVNRMPIIQIMQNYTPQQELHRVKYAQKVEYYLEARKIIESIFQDESFYPRIWENYRGLFYYTYQNKPLKCLRI